jgi:hypothetical protein
LNRTFILNINSIKDVLVYSNSRLKITLVQEFDKEIIVSREKVGEFKDWFDGSRAHLCATIYYATKALMQVTMSTHEPQSTRRIF